MLRLLRCAAPQVVLDWKGEPMKIRPGDKLPFKF